MANQPETKTSRSTQPRIAIVLGSTRPNRNGEGVATWVLEMCKTRTDARYELIDIAQYDLPLLDEPIPPSMGQYSKPHTKRWAAAIDGFDGFLFVTPEYNHGISGALKNAIDFLYKEWNNKAAAFVGYGSVGAVRAVEHLRTVMAELQVATVRAQVILSLRDDFENYSVFKPRPFHAADLDAALKQLVTWAQALRATRSTGAQEAPSPAEHAEAPSAPSTRPIMTRPKAP